MPIYIPTIINELRENTTEEQRKGLSILENRFYECIELKKENSELVQKMHILNEANMNIENTVGKLGEQLKEANEVIKKAAELCPDKNTMLLSIPPKPSEGKRTYDVLNEYLEKWSVE